MFMKGVVFIKCVRFYEKQQISMFESVMFSNCIDLMYYYLIHTVSSMQTRFVCFIVLCIIDSSDL